MDRLAVDGVSIAFDRQGGVIDHFRVEPSAAGGMDPIAPLHRAPWVETGEALPDSVAPVERRLAGDFFCAPFGRTSDALPIHGWTANAAWLSVHSQHSHDGALEHLYRLERDVSGADVTKSITLRPGQPVVYQRHVFEGGLGRIPVAHHAMLHLPGGAALSFSSKDHGATMAAALETDPARGRSILRYPQRFTDMASVALADGGTVNASTYPFAQSHEDLIVLTEAKGASLGWSAAVAVSQGFVFFAIKDARVLPQTILWMSNGGRDYTPWNGRHRAVIGIEEAVTGLLLDEKDRGDAGITLGGTVTISYAFGAISLAEGWTRVADLSVGENVVTLTDVGGGRRIVPFDGQFFGER